MGVYGSIRKAVLDGAMMALVSGLSLLLLIYVGYGEAMRTYQQFQIEKLAAQGRVMQSSMESFLLPGLPMRQFIGFKAQSDRILASDATIAAMVAFDSAGATVFANGSAELPLLLGDSEFDGDDGGGIDLRENDDYLQVVLPLRDRFEVVGSLAISMPRSVVADRVSAEFVWLLVVAGGVSGFFGLLVAVGGSHLAGERRRWLHVAYALTFLGMSIGVVVTLISLYSEGAQAKTTALADSLGQRLSSIVRSGLNITEIRGLEQVFSDYQRLNPDISAAGLIVDSVVTIHTDRSAVGQPWVGSPGTYEYQVNLTRPGGRDIRVSVALPTDVIYRQIARSVKNFTALFVASAFMAHLFLQLAGSFRRRRDSEEEGTAPLARPVDDFALNLIKPVFFLATFVEHLTYAFLPQYVHRVTEAAGLPDGAASAVFMSYYLYFAASLVPAGHIAQRFSARPLMHGGLLLAALGLLLMGTTPSFLVLVLARAMAGVGQGLLFIGVQSYILAKAGPDRKTQGASIIVYGFQGGMISGMAIGSLLVSQMGASGVFWLGAAIAAVMAIYTRVLVPRTGAGGLDDDESEGTLRLLMRDLSRVLKNADFLRTMILIGIPAKAVLTGVVVFAMPLLMAQSAFAQEDIGQIMMVYAAGVLLTNAYVSRVVDDIGETEHILFLGSVLSGLAMIIIAATGWPMLVAVLQGTPFVTVMLVVGIAALGIAHGMINAPVVTHVAKSRLAILLGQSSVTANYRFLERIGHIAGPIIVGQLFMFLGQSPSVIGILGVVVTLMAFMFVLRLSTPKEVSL